MHSNADVTIRLAGDRLPGPNAVDNHGPRRTPVSAESLLASLDGREISIRSDSWRIEPYGVWDARGRRWIQLALRALEADRDHVLTLKLVAGASAQHALLALTSWLADPSTGPDILNVA